MIIWSKEPAKLKSAIRHLLDSEGVHCVHCGNDFGPVAWEGEMFIYEHTYLTEHSTMLTLEEEEEYKDFYVNCKDQKHHGKPGQRRSTRHCNCNGLGTDGTKATK